MFRRTQSDEVVDSCKYAAGSCVWRSQSNEVIDGCKGSYRKRIPHLSCTTKSAVGRHSSKPLM